MDGHCRFACAGLRTLCIAEKELDPTHYRTWNARFQKASVSFNGRKAKLEQLAEEIEVDLELLGATGIEDKLQDGVPETIECLLQAGIKVWVLTGDKRETAINVGKACNLLKSGMITLIVSSDNKINAKQRLGYLLGLIASQNWARLAKENERDDSNYAEAMTTPIGSGARGGRNKEKAVIKPPSTARSRERGTAQREARPRPELALVIEGRTLVHALEYDVKFTVRFA